MSVYTKTISYNDYPNSQKLPCHNGDTYIFERKRYGHNIITDHGEKFGPYLYRNQRNGVLIASYEKPIPNIFVYNEAHLGMCADAMQYYKNN